MSQPDPRLESLAQAITDETPVDWSAAEAATPGRLDVVRNLQTLAEIAEVGRRSAPGSSVEPTTALFSWGHLSVLEKLGAGSFADVFRARDTVLGREVALKLRRAPADDGGSRRWLDESSRLARVRHPNVLVVHGAAVHDGRAGIWTDLVHGHTLEDLVAERGALGAREATLIGIDLCGALAAVHAAGLIHGDLKTRNVMRVGDSLTADGSGRIVLMDFGSASEAGNNDLFPLGTPLACAPELLAGAPANAGTDLYALGVLLYRLVTGRYPVAASSLSELESKLARAERTPLRTARPDLPPDFVNVVERALALSPAERFASAAEFERALVETLPRPSEAGVRRSFPVARVALAAVVLLAVALTLVWMSSGGRRKAVTVASSPPAPVATSGAVTPATVPVVPRPPDVDATFERVNQGPGEPLRDGDRIDPGDRLALAISARERVYAYVLNEDKRGSLYVLFPIRGRGESNPLAAGVRHRLPGRSSEGDLDWQVTSAGGEETFLLLAAREPLAAVESALRALPAAREGAPVSYAPLRPEALGRIRGVGGVEASHRDAEAAPGRRLTALARSLSDPSSADPIWVRLIVLENPGD